MKPLKYSFFQVVILAFFFFTTCHPDEIIEIDPDLCTGNCTSIKVSTTWHDKYSDPEKADYVVEGQLSLHAKLTLKPGVVIAFKERGSLHVFCDGKLVADGTESNHIVFRGDEPIERFWQGITLTSSSADNKLNYCDILHTGKSNSNSPPAAIELYDIPSTLLWNGCKPHLKISNCTVKEAAGYGVIVLGASYIDTFYNNDISVNGTAAFLMNFPTLSKLDNTSVLESSEGVGIEIQSGNGGGNEYVELKKIRGNAVYLLSGKAAYTDELRVYIKNLEISKGVEVRLADNTSLRVNSISAIGTADEPIIFTGIGSFSPQWAGMSISSNNSMNKLEYCEIKDGGSNVIHGSWPDSILANIVLGKSDWESTDFSSLIITNCVIGKSAGCGIYVHEGGLLTESNNTYINNQGGDICE